MLGFSYEFIFTLFINAGHFIIASWSKLVKKSLFGIVLNNIEKNYSTFQMKFGGLMKWPLFLNAVQLPCNYTSCFQMFRPNMKKIKLKWKIVVLFVRQKNSTTTKNCTHHQKNALAIQTHHTKDFGSKRTSAHVPVLNEVKLTRKTFHRLIQFAS